MKIREDWMVKTRTTLIKNLLKVNLDLKPTMAMGTISCQVFVERNGKKNSLKKTIMATTMILSKIEIKC